MFLIRRLIVVLLALLPMAAVAQVDEAIEQWVDERGSDVNASELSDLLLQLSASPVNLNDTASLSSLPFLSPFQVKAVCNYIALYGQLLYVEELLMVPGFDSIAVARLAPLVKAEPFVPEGSQSLGEMLRRGHHTLVSAVGGTVEQAAGYADGSYEGDNLKALLNYRFVCGNKLSLQLSADKDPTEAWGKDNFYGYSLTLNDIGPLERLVVGRFNVQFGQGVALWTGFEPFSLIGSSPVRYAGGIKAASPFAEEGWQQGVAATVGLGHEWKVSAFGSRADGEWMGGGHLAWHHGNLILGLTATGSLLDDSLQLRDYAYNQDYFRGDRTGVMGVDAMWQSGSVMLFGEGAVDAGGGFALLGGVQCMLGGENSLGLTLRHYPADYHALHAAAHALGSTRNEQGLSLNAQLHLPLQTTMLVSADVHRFPSLRYGNYAPSAGSWLRVQIGRNFGRRVEASLRYVFREQDRNIPSIDSNAYLGETMQRHQLQSQVRYTNGAWRFTTRAILSRHVSGSGGAVGGWLVAEEVRYTMGRWQATVQAVWHDIEDYYARISLTESNLQYSFSIPSLQGRGLRVSAVVRCDVGRWLNLAFKYTLTARPGEETLGSGAAATEGPLRQTWHLQARWKL